MNTGSQGFLAFTTDVVKTVGTQETLWPTVGNRLEVG